VRYLDASAIVKLVAREPETADLVESIRAEPEVVSSAVSWTEVIRAVRRARGRTTRAEEVLEGIPLVPLDEGILRVAGELTPTELRTLDAIQLATALSLGSDLDGLVTYDNRLGKAAAASGLQVFAPGSRSGPPET
jgi:uncharacterized protein